MPDVHKVSWKYVSGCSTYVVCKWTGGKKTRWHTRTRARAHTRKLAHARTHIHTREQATCNHVTREGRTETYMAPLAVCTGAWIWLHHNARGWITRGRVNNTTATQKLHNRQGQQQCRRQETLPRWPSGLWCRANLHVGTNVSEKTYSLPFQG